MSAACEEGGQHNWATKERTSCCGLIFKILFFPCYCFFSCALSQGAAGASQLQFKGEEEGNGETICKKCGLTRNESIALAEVKMEEAAGRRTSKGTNYFTRMSVPPSPNPEHLQQPQQTQQYNQQQYQPHQQLQQQQQQLQYSSSSPNSNQQQGESRQDQAVGSWLATLPPPANNRSNQS